MFFMETTDNFQKHTKKNFLQKALIGNFYTNLTLLVKESRSKEIIDVGCGEGFTIDRLQKNGVKANFIGVDFLDKAIKIGRKMYPKLNLKKSNIYKLPFKNGSFDLTICTEVLEHLEDPNKAVRELKRVTRKFILFSVPNEPFFMTSNFLRGKNLSRWGNDIEHINHWSFLSFEKFLMKNNLKIKKRKLPFPWTMILVEV